MGLTQALTLTVTPLARESITLQHSYHLRQQQLLRFRSQQHEKYMKAVENQRRKMGSVSGSGGSSGGGAGSGGGMFRENTPPSRGSFRRTESLTAEISKNTEKFNSLLLMLIPEEEEEDLKDKDNEKPGKSSQNKDVPMESEPK